MIKLDPSTGVRSSWTRSEGTHTRPRRVTLDLEFAEQGGEGATPYEVLLHAAMVGESTRFTRQDGVEETLADHAAAARRAAAGASRTRRGRGARRRRTSWWPATAAGTARG